MFDLSSSPAGWALTLCQMNGNEALNSQALLFHPVVGELVNHLFDDQRAAFVIAQKFSSLAIVLVGLSIA